MGKYYAKPGVVVPGLTYCRVAAALSERDLAKLVDSNQTTINLLEAKTWVKADYRLLRRLCRVLKVRPADLMSPKVVEVKPPRSGWAESALRKERDERRRQVNRIKRGRTIFVNFPSVRLGGLKEHRERAGISQRELARMIGTNLTTIRQLEKRRSRGAYMKTVRKLCDVLNVQPADLVGFDPVKSD
jgi:DNA-binding Xre family transcriptional regulator